MSSMSGMDIELPSTKGTTMKRTSRRTIRAAATVALVGLLASPASADPASRDFRPVAWHAQTGGTDVVDGASASLVRTDSGISFRLQARDLTPGNAYTLWLVVIDEPDQCAAAPAPCAAPDLIGNEGPDAQVTYAAGMVVGASGHATFSGHQSVGPMDGWLPDRSFDNPRGAEVHLVVNDHGPKLAEHMPGMIHTYRGGCADDSPFPGFFPDTALADGAAGPNTCRLTQSAVFQP